LPSVLIVVSSTQQFYKELGLLHSASFVTGRRAPECLRYQHKVCKNEIAWQYTAGRNRNEVSEHYQNVFWWRFCAVKHWQKGWRKCYCLRNRFAVPGASVDFFFIQKKSKSFSFILLSVYLSITDPGFLFCDWSLVQTEVSSRKVSENVVAVA